MVVGLLCAGSFKLAILVIQPFLAVVYFQVVRGPAYSPKRVCLPSQVVIIGARNKSVKRLLRGQEESIIFGGALNRAVFELNVCHYIKEPPNIFQSYFILGSGSFKGFYISPQTSQHNKSTSRTLFL